MRINLQVKPNAKKNEIKEENGTLKVSLKEAAEKGKANKELIKLLSKHFKKQVKIVSGLKSRKKTIELE